MLTPASSNERHHKLRIQVVKSLRMTKTLWMLRILIKLRSSKVAFSACVRKHKNEMTLDYAHALMCNKINVILKINDETSRICIFKYVAKTNIGI